MVYNGVAATDGNALRFLVVAALVGSRFFVHFILKFSRKKNNTMESISIKSRNTGKHNQMINSIAEQLKNGIPVFCAMFAQEKAPQMIEEIQSITGKKHLWKPSYNTEKGKANKKYVGFSIFPYISFYAADTKTGSIISYGDICGVRRFKTTWKNNIYSAWKLVGKKYELVGEGNTLDIAHQFCALSLVS